MKGRCLALMVLAMMPCVVSADDGIRLAGESWDPSAPCSPRSFAHGDWDSKPLPRDSLPTLVPMPPVWTTWPCGSPSVWETPVRGS